MKPFIAFILLFALLSFQLSELMIYVSFKINQDYIAKNLCIEKDIEGSTCKGCCQLEKKLNENENQKKDTSVPANTKQDVTLFSEKLFQFNFIDRSSEILNYFILNKYSFLTAGLVFHPPRIF